NNYDISKSELEDFFLHGAKAAVRKYNLRESELDRMEYHGDVLGEQEKSKIDFKSLVPRSSYINGRHEIGYNFGGNHFLEFHYVEEIKDTETARAWGISQNQILMFYHGGGGHATYHLGRYFGRREKNTPSQKFVLFFLKFIFHFGSRAGLKHFRERWCYYFSRRLFPEIPLNSEEGARLMQSIKIALNYGYAFRAALLRRIKDALPKGDASFLWDAAHNSIIEETVGDKNFIVHRQDATRVFPGKPVMLAGFNTVSYLGVGQEGASISLFSSTPSAGKTIAKYKKEGLSKPDPGHPVLVSKRKEPKLKKEEGTTSEGLFAVTRELEEAGIVKSVAYIRPLGLIKGH
ncbi:MAG: RtcB family protein, partial [Patescibacteria group bacterium]